MSGTQLQTPIIDGGIRSINFFNGRLLSARDLTLEQSAYREADRRLGKAIGDGVGYGLEVSQATGSTKESPAVSIEAGLAINRLGQTLMLGARTDVALVRSSDASHAAAGFSECLPLQTGAYIAGAGVYLLTIAPTQASEGRATTSALNPATTTCNTDTVVAAVQFRLIQIDSALTPTELADANHLRNVLAYKCFGMQETSAFIANPFASEQKQWGLLDDLRPNQLTDCEVPLAVLYWTDQSGITFIDMWSVRRRTAGGYMGAWPPFEGDQSLATAEACLLQFRDQLDDLRTSSSAPSQLRALDSFKYLPPVGLLPTEAAAGGVALNKFFEGLTVRGPVFVDSAQVEHLYRASVPCGAIELQQHEVIWLYEVRENVQPGAASVPTPSYTIFANGHIPPIGVGRFNLGRWNYSNYAIL